MRYLLILCLEASLVLLFFSYAGGETKTASDISSSGVTADFLATGRYPVRTQNLEAGARKVQVKKRARIVDISLPGELTHSDTEYRLVNDIVADQTAFVIKASSVTLNLNGHTIVYHQKNSTEKAHGVEIPGYHRKDIAIANGRIMQSPGSATPGSHPIYNYDASNIEIAGLEIIYSSPDTCGILLHWVNNVVIHHNTLRDLGNKVNNRHQGVAVIEANRGGKGRNYEIHHNAILGARQNGIRAGKESNIYNNEVIIDSVVTNSTGISASGRIYQNRVVGSGVHPIGIWPGSNVEIRANYVEVQNTVRGSEYGDTGASCLRMTWGNDDVEVMNNTFILKGEENYQKGGVTSWGRALWVGLPKPEQKALFHGNLIVALNADGKAKAAAVAVVCENESAHLEFRDNAIISNWANILLADSYGHADGFARFVGNRIIREGNDNIYRTILSQYSERPSTATLIDNTFENGASLENIDLEFTGAGRKELEIGWRLFITVHDKTGPVPGARVEITDRFGNQVFSGTTGGDGKAVAETVSYLLTNQENKGRPAGTFAKLFDRNGRRLEKTPHTITVTHNGQRKSLTIEVDATRDVAVRL